MPVQPLPPVQIATLGAGSNPPPYQTGATTSLGFSLNVPPVEAANLQLLNQILAQFVTPNDLPNLTIVKTQVFTVSASQLLNLVNAPVLLLPGIPGTFTQMISCIVEYVAGSVAYTVPFSYNFQVQLGGSAAAPVETPFTEFPGQGFVDQPTSQVVALLNSFTQDQLVSSQANNVGIYLTSPSLGNLSSGNGTLKISISYDAFVL